MTPTQLRAFAAVVRLGSVKKAAVDLEVSEAAVSLNIGQLRKELGDRLYVRTASGIASSSALFQRTTLRIGPSQWSTRPYDSEPMAARTPPHP